MLFYQPLLIKDTVNTIQEYKYHKCYKSIL
jgi:hypothetical protein